jgi:hypothetical protein
MCPLRPAGCSNYWPRPCKSHVDGRPTVPHSLLEIIIIRSDDCFIEHCTLSDDRPLRPGTCRSFVYIETLVIVTKFVHFVASRYNNLIIMHPVENVISPLIASPCSGGTVLHSTPLYPKLSLE